MLRGPVTDFRERLFSHKWPRLAATSGIEVGC